MRRTCGAIATALVLALLTPATAIAVPVATDYFVKDASKDGVYMDMAIKPQAVHRGDHTYVAYQGRSLDPYIVAYDHTNGAWTPSYRVGDNPLTTDMHGAPALVIDDAGYIHVFFGGHHTPLKHSRSSSPLDVTSWDDMPDVAPSFTYPQPLLFPDGSIELYYRDGSLDWVRRRSTDGGLTWSSTLKILDGNAAYGFYASFTRGVDNEVYATFLSLDWEAYFAGTSWARHNVYFVRRGTDGVWRSADGVAVPLPVTPTTADSAPLIYDSGSAITNNTIARPGADGRPCVLFNIGSGAGPTSYRYVFGRFDGSTWDFSDVTTTDHFFDADSMSVRPDGTIDAYVVCDGTRGAGTGDRDYTDDGGLVKRFSSTDSGATWDSGTTVSPDVPEAIYNNPQAVEGADEHAELLMNEWVSGPSTFSLRLYLRGPDDFVGSAFEPQVRRHAGGDRIDTAVKISTEAFPTGSETVVLARADQYPDALAGGPLAYALRGPLLLTNRTSLPSSVASEIRRLSPKRIVVLGGTSAVSAGVLTAARAAAPKAVYERIGGRDRYDTAGRIATRLAGTQKPFGHRAVVVTGIEFADAVAVGGWAAYRGMPILMAEQAWLPPSTVAALDSLDITSTIVVGDEGRIGPGVYSRLPSPTRYGGTDRYATAALVAAASLEDGMLPDRFVVASGRVFADGLAGAVLAARLRAPLLLTPPAALPAAEATILEGARGDVVECRIVGGTSAVSTTVGASLVDLMTPAP